MPPAPEVLRFACPAELSEVALSLPGRAPHTLRLDPCGDDEEQHLTIDGQPVVLRRVRCTVSDGLLRRGEPRWALCPQTRAALLWRAFQRYSELVGLKRLSGGLSGSDVLVFRPRLRAPRFGHAGAVASSGPPDVLDGTWGSPLLVKTGPAGAIFQEWARAETFLRDRQSPFVVRPEEHLDVRPVGPAPARPRATIVSTFLGGEVAQAEPFDQLVRGCPDADRCTEVIDRVVAHLATWHTDPVDRRLAEWPRLFRFASDGPPPDPGPGGAEAPWLLFGQFNFRKRRQGDAAGWDTSDPWGQPSLGRAEFAAGLGWDIPFGKEDHLSGHLLGRPGRRDGLLHRLMDLPARFSLVHGDLNPRNVLCDPDRVWLIDFQHTEVGPVLADLARLEASFRLWCAEAGAGGRNAVDAARRLELFLLDHFHGSECSLEPVRGLAPGLGLDPDELVKVARCVVHLRGRARRWCRPGFADGRDYLAVLYLTVLSLLRYAGRGRSPAGNERWLVGLCWALEESLDRLLGRDPFDRGQQSYDPVHHVSAGWLAAADAPRRVEYVCGTADGREALEPVHALRGVLQGGYHHLDAYQHTLSVLAYLEALLADPVGGLLDPAGLDRAVAGRLREYGLAVPPPAPGQADPPAVAVPWFGPHQDRVAAFLSGVLTDEARLVLKWCGLLHDVGKPGTRAVRERGAARDVQFVGHEVYGVALLGSRLAAWFPGEDPEGRGTGPVGRRLADLIRNHHRSHQLVGDYFLRQPDRLARLTALVGGASDPGTLGWLREHCGAGGEESRPDLPLLLLHGYADRLAARGHRHDGSVGDWAAVTLALLSYLACEPDLVAAQDRRDGQAEAAEQAALAYATELRDAGQLDRKDFGRAMSLLKDECRSRAGTRSELLDYLRARVGGAALAERLRLRGR